MMTPRLVTGLLAWALLCVASPATAGEATAVEGRSVTVTLHRATVREAAIEVLCALAAVPPDGPVVDETELRAAAYDADDIPGTLATYADYGVVSLRKGWPRASREKLVSLWVGCLLLPGMDDEQTTTCLGQLVAFAAEAELPIDALIDLDVGRPAFGRSRPLRRSWFDGDARKEIAAVARREGEHRQGWLSLAAIAGCPEVAPILAEGVVEDIAGLAKAGAMPVKLKPACEANARYARLDPDAGEAGIRALGLALGAMHISDCWIAIRSLCASRHDLALPSLLETLKDDATVWPKGFDPDEATEEERAQENGGPIGMVVWSELAHLLEGVPEDLLPYGHPQDTEEKHRKRFEGFRRWAAAATLVFIR